jgi:hypothetical protein
MISPGIPRGADLIRYPLPVSLKGPNPEEHPMPRPPEHKAAEHLSSREGEVLLPRPGGEKDERPTEVVTLGAGTRSPVVEGGNEPAPPQPCRGLLPVPPEVEAEIKRQEAKHPMTPEYRKRLSDGAGRFSGRFGDRDDDHAGGGGQTAGHSPAHPPRSGTGARTNRARNPSRSAPGPGGWHGRHGVRFPLLLPGLGGLKCQRHG